MGETIDCSRSVIQGCLERDDNRRKNCRSWQEKNRPEMGCDKFFCYSFLTFFSRAIEPAHSQHEKCPHLLRIQLPSQTFRCSSFWGVLYGSQAFIMTVFCKANKWLLLNAWPTVFKVHVFCADLRKEKRNVKSAEEGRKKDATVVRRGDGGRAVCLFSFAMGDGTIARRMGLCLGVFFVAVGFTLLELRPRSRGTYA